MIKKIRKNDSYAVHKLSPNELLKKLNPEQNRQILVYEVFPNLLLTTFITKDNIDESFLDEQMMHIHQYFSMSSD